MQAQIVVDALGMGLSTTRAWNLLNMNEVDEGREAMSLSAVTSLVGKLKPKLVHTKKRKQGSRNPSNPWYRACNYSHLVCHYIDLETSDYDTPGIGGVDSNAYGSTVTALITYQTPFRVNRQPGDITFG